MSQKGEIEVKRSFGEEHFGKIIEKIVTDELIKIQIAAQKEQ